MTRDRCDTFFYIEIFFNNKYIYLKGCIFKYNTYNSSKHLSHLSRVTGVDGYVRLDGYAVDGWTEIAGID